jgi:hypothetical protein
VTTTQFAKRFGALKKESSEPEESESEKAKNRSVRDDKKTSAFSEGMSTEYLSTKYLISRDFNTSENPEFIYPWSSVEQVESSQLDYILYMETVK